MLGCLALMAYKPDALRIFWEESLPKCHIMSGRTGKERAGESGRDGKGGKGSALTLIPAAKNSLRNKQLPTAVQSITLVGSRRQAGGSAAVGAAFINQTAGAEPRLAPLNRKPPGVLSRTSYSSGFRYCALCFGWGGANKDRKID